MTDSPELPEPRLDAPADDSDERKPLRRRIADKWASYGPAQKGKAITVGLTVLGGVVALAVLRPGRSDCQSNEPDDLEAMGADRDDTPRLQPVRSRSGGPVSGYQRNQCLNTRGHSGGRCTHEQRWVDDYERTGTK